MLRVLEDSNLRAKRAKKQGESKLGEAERSRARFSFPKMTNPTDLMAEAIKEARKAYLLNEVPVGAVLALPDGTFIADHNRTESRTDPTAHAEMLVIRKAAERINNWRLTGSTLCVTLEPCPMCMGAIRNARISTVIFGVTDPRCGACGTVYDLSGKRSGSPDLEVISGIEKEACRALLQEFFAERRLQVVGKTEAA